MYNRKLRSPSRALGDYAASCSCPSPGESDSAQTAPKRVSKSLSLRGRGEDAHSWSSGHARIGGSPFSTNLGLEASKNPEWSLATICSLALNGELMISWEWPVRG